MPSVGFSPFYIVLLIIARSTLISTFGLGGGAAGKPAFTGKTIKSDFFFLNKKRFFYEERGMEVLIYERQSNVT